jgi:hypothetical protein
MTLMTHHVDLLRDFGARPQVAISTFNLIVCKRAKDLQCRLALVAHHQLHIVTQAVPKNEWGQPGNACPDLNYEWRSAVPQADALREDETYPVGPITFVG